MDENDIIKANNFFGGGTQKKGKSKWLGIENFEKVPKTAVKKNNL